MNASLATNPNSIYRHIPNAITIARLFAVPLAVWLILVGAHLSAFWVFVAAGVSDGIDGYLAKHLNARSRLGAFLDPLADKALLVAVFISLAAIDLIPVWFVAVVIARDLVILCGAAAFRLKTGKLEIAPLMIGKINTVAQVLTAGAFLAATGFALEVRSSLDIMIILTALTTVGSGLVYVVRWTKMAFGDMENR